MNNQLMILSHDKDITTEVGRLPETEDDKKALANALSSPTGGLSEIVNHEVDLINYYLEKTEVTDKDTGEVRETIRMVLILADGTSFGCISKGAVNSLKGIVSVYGPASTWDAPLKITVKEDHVGKGRLYRLRVV